MKIGLFGGTFDPIHDGHLNLARCIQDNRHLDQVLFCPAALSPFKQSSPPTPLHHRLKMVELAIQGIPGFKLLDWEAKRPPPSYTIDTLHALKEHDRQTGQNNSYYLILGGDSVAGFPRWKSAREILGIAPLLIGKRVEQEMIIDEDAPPWLQKAVVEGWVPIPIIAASSTEIRQRLKHGLDCHGLVPQKVLDYISDYKLY